MSQVHCKLELYEDKDTRHTTFKLYVPFLLAKINLFGPYRGVVKLPVGAPYY